MDGASRPDAASGEDPDRGRDATGGFDFLGYHFERGYRWPRKKSLEKLKDAIRAKTRRTNGHSLACIIAELNRTLRGWFEYFKHSHRTTFARSTAGSACVCGAFCANGTADAGRGRGGDHQRWPNAYFAEQGLFSLGTAHVLASPSSRR